MSDTSDAPIRPALDVIIPALDAAAHIDGTLASLAEGAHLIRQVLLVDGGSGDDTAARAERAGAAVIGSPRGRGAQLAAGAAAAEADWLLFLHADTRLAPGWAAAAAAFVGGCREPDRAAAFTLAFDDRSVPARSLARLANWRARRLGLPYGDQGLLISRGFYERLGGFRPLPLMEDVDLVRRIGRRRLTVLDAVAVTSGERYRRAGWWLRAARNLALLALYFLGAPPRLLKHLYG